MPFTAEQKRQRRAEQAEAEGREPGKAGRPADTGCAACTGTARLHSCEDFPLPDWAPDYLAAVDRRVAAGDLLPIADASLWEALEPRDDVSREVVLIPAVGTGSGRVRQTDVRAFLPVVEVLTRYPERLTVAPGEMSGREQAEASEKRAARRWREVLAAEQSNPCRVTVDPSLVRPGCVPAWRLEKRRRAAEQAAAAGAARQESSATFRRQNTESALAAPLPFDVKARD